MNRERRRLGLVSATALVVANMIGAGVFTTSGFALADLGRPELVLLAWFLGGLVALCGALSYGALARRIPESGGEYTFLARTVHPLVGFLAGWISLLAGFTAPIAAAALGLQAYLAPSLGWTVGPGWVATGAIAAAAVMHGVRLRQGVVVQNLMVGLKLVLIAAFVILGAIRMPARAEPVAMDFSGVDLTAFALTLVWISFSYSGWNAAVYVAGEVRDPQRNVPRSLVLAMCVVAALYLALNAIFLYSVPSSELAGKAEVGAISAQALGGDALRTAVSMVVALALFTSISSMVMVGPRVYARMAEDGLFPRLFVMGEEVPRAAVVLQAGFAILVVWMSDLKELLGYIGFTLGLSAAATVGGMISLRVREGADRIPVPGYPWVPSFFILMTLGAAAFMAVRAPAQAGIGLLTVAGGIPVYWLMRSSKER